MSEPCIALYTSFIDNQQSVYQYVYEREILNILKLGLTPNPIPRHPNTFEIDDNAWLVICDRLETGKLMMMGLRMIEHFRYADTLNNYNSAVQDAQLIITHATDLLESSYEGNLTPIFNRTGYPE